MGREAIHYYDSFENALLVLLSRDGGEGSEQADRVALTHLRQLVLA